jgi:hypothetical protein
MQSARYQTLLATHGAPLYPKVLDLVLARLLRTDHTSEKPGNHAPTRQNLFLSFLSLSCFTRGLFFAPRSDLGFC